MFGFSPLASDAFSSLPLDNEVVALTGVSGISSIGALSVFAPISTTLVGVSCAGMLGDIDVRGQANTSIIGVNAGALSGNILAVIPRITEVTGVAAEGSLGGVSVIPVNNVRLLGVFAAGNVSRPLVWGIVPNAQSAGWQDIDDQQPTNWESIPVR